MIAREVGSLVAKNRLQLALSPEAWFDALLGLTGVCVQFLFANHTLDTDPRELRPGFEPIAVEPQMFDLLISLCRTATAWSARTISYLGLRRPDLVRFDLDQAAG